MALIASSGGDWRTRSRRVATAPAWTTLPFVSQFSTPTPTADAERAFEQFIERYERDVFGFLWRMTGDEQAAYDLSQEAFLRAWRHFDRVTTYEQPRAWLFRVATHLALNYRRDQASRSGALALDEADAQSRSPDPTLQVLERDSIEASLLLLPKRMRAALILRDVYGYTSEEIAAVLKVSHAAAKMTISRAREQFRQSYLREGAK